MKLMKMATISMVAAFAAMGVSATANAGEFDGVTVNILTRPGPVIAGPLKERGAVFEKETGAKIVVNEVPGIDAELAAKLVATGRKGRLLKDHGLEEATSTRALVYAANMINAGLDPVNACQVAMVNPLTDDVELAEALMEIVKAHFN